VRYGSYRAAAEKLFRSQPALSQAIIKLEGQLGFELFDRTGYRPVLTSTGESFYSRSKLAIASMESLELLGKHLSMDYEPVLNVVIDAICPFPEILRQLKYYSDKFPNTEINISSEALSGTLERLMDGEAELAFLATPIPNENLEVVPVDVVNMVTVVSPEMGLTIKDKTYTKEDLSDYVQIILADSGRHTEAISVGVIEDLRRWTVRDRYTKQQLIKAGLGWGGLPEHEIRDSIKNGELAPIRVQGIDTPSIIINLTRRLDQPHGKVASAIWGRFQNIQ
jgi:DNA-binding transcriptional LysR family regulator